MRPMEGPFSADSEEKRAPVSDINTALVDRLKALDPNRPIREADISKIGAPVECIKIRLQTGSPCAPRARGAKLHYNGVYLRSVTALAGEQQRRLFEDRLR